MKGKDKQLASADRSALETFGGDYHRLESTFTLPEKSPQSPKHWAGKNARRRNSKRKT